LYSPEVATYRFANTISAEYRKFSFPPFHLAPSFGVCPFEQGFEQALLFLKLESSGQPTVKIL